MRRIAIGIGSVLALAGVGLYAFLSPTVLEWRVERACPQITGDCAIRTRALAHIWFDKGETERAVHWYRWGAEAGDPISMFHLAWTIEQPMLDRFKIRSYDTAPFGKGSPVPAELRSALDEATSWYRKSADKGFAPATNNLGQTYLRGVTTARNPDAAAHHFRLAALAGNPIAGFNLATAHLAGEGVAKSLSEAEKWMEWTPARKFNPADLNWPTLERTRFKGVMIVQSMRERIRYAADAGPPATARLYSGPVVSGLPSFEETRRQSGGSRR